MGTPKPRQVSYPEATLIGTSVAIKGEVSCDEELYIDGQVEGTFDPKGHGQTIGPNGRVKADIIARTVIARTVVVQGKLEGNIQASDRVDLKGSATVVGHIVTKRISIDEGACLKGSVCIQNEAPQESIGGINGGECISSCRRIPQNSSECLKRIQDLI